MSQTDSVARIEECGQVLGDLALVQLDDVAQPGELVVERNVWQLLQHHRQHPSHASNRGEPLLCDGVQEVGDKLEVVKGSEPDWTSDMVRVGAELALSVDWWPQGSAVLDLTLPQSK